MPILIHVNELHPGMQLAENVIHNYTVLVSRGHYISESEIGILRHIAPDCLISIVDADLDQDEIFAEKPKDRTIDLEEVRKLEENIRNISEKTHALLLNNFALDANHIAEQETLVSQMLESIRNNPVTINVLEPCTSWPDSMQRQSMNVLYFSLLIVFAFQDFIEKIDARIKYSHKKQQQKNLILLSTAALFHDIGMIPIQDLCDKTKNLTEEEKSKIKAHPVAGYELLPEQIDSKAREAVLHHHENFDGSGYPGGLKGKDINIFARILRIADTYTAASIDKVYAEAKKPIKVLYDMVYGDDRHCFDPELTRIFACGVQLLPIGAKVKLNNGEYGVITRHNFDNPFNPQVIIAFDDRGRKLPKDNMQLFSLAERKDIQVASFRDQDLSFLNSDRIETSLKLSDDRLFEIYHEIYDESR
jgi:HD domain-containing protein